MQHQSRSPDNIRIDNRQADNRILWNSPDWQWLRIIFLSSPENKGGCSWCGNIASVVAHPGTIEVYRDKELYLNFRRAGAYPLCGPCNRAEYRGYVLCPRCRQQGHYVPAGIDGKGDGRVCWSCMPAEEREALVYGKEHRNRTRNELNRAARDKWVPHKVYNTRTGKWIKVFRG